MRVRMGLHTGEAGRSDEGYIGLAVHKAARIGDAGHGGQVLLSATTAALVEHELPEGVGLRDLGEAALEGLERPERLFQLEIEGLPSEFPPLSAPRARGSGPVLLERDAELAAVTALVHAAFDGTGRLVAIEGRAGLGKTRLLTEVRSVAAATGMDVLVARGGELEAEFLTASCGSSSSGARRGRGRTAGRSCSRARRRSPSALFDERRLAEALAGGAADTSFAMLHGLFWLTAQSGGAPPAVTCDRRPALVRRAVAALAHSTCRGGSRACRCSSWPRRARPSRRPRSSC